MINFLTNKKNRPNMKKPHPDTLSMMRSISGNQLLLFYIPGNLFRTRFHFLRRKLLFGITEIQIIPTV